MDYKRAIEDIVNRLKLELPNSLKYHSVDHTVAVINAAEKLAERQGISLEEMKLLLTAAAYHDAGFLRTYENHELIGCEIAEEELPKYGYHDEQIELIKGMIMATKIPQTPKTKLEKILCDADLVYLGGDHYDKISVKLRDELRLQGYDLDETKWLNMQINFLEVHEYWTLQYKDRLSQNKQDVLTRLKSQVTT